MMRKVEGKVWYSIIYIISNLTLSLYILLPRDPASESTFVLFFPKSIAGGGKGVSLILYPAKSESKAAGLLKYVSVA